MQRILLIDESPPDAQSLRRDFAAVGYSVDVAGSGDVGLTAVRMHPPDLVVLDRARADMEGVQLLQRLHATAEQVPVLLVVPDPTPVDQVRWLDSGADDCVALTQPFEVVLARPCRTSSVGTQVRLSGASAFTAIMTTVVVSAGSCRRTLEKGLSRMPQRMLPIWTLSLIGLLLLFAPVSQVRADTGVTHTLVTVDGYSAELVFLNGSAKVGPNLVVIQIHNAAGQPLDRATVLINPVATHPLGASTPNHGDSGHDAAGMEDHSQAQSAGHIHANGESHIDTIMTQMEVGTEVGTYTSTIHFDSAGAWDVQLQFTNIGVDHLAHFAVTVAEPARDWRILGAFGGANTLIIVTAGILKRRRPASGKTLRRATAAGAEK